MSELPPLDEYPYTLSLKLDVFYTEKEYRKNSKNWDT